jgi:hypothetical protein
MSFEVYSVPSRALILQIDNDRVIPMSKDIENGIRRIHVADCFPRGHSEDDIEREFGKNVKVVTEDHPLYIKALKMYWEVQIEAHPGLYAKKLSSLRPRSV